MPSLLIVEDDVAHRRALASGLEARGYEIVGVGDGAAARAATDVRRPDLVLLDLGLPDIDGVELCRHLAVWPGAPVIVVSGDDDDQRMVDAFSVGAVDYVVKPVVLDVLAARIAVHVRQAARLVELSSGDVIEVGDVCVDMGAFEAVIGGQPVQLGRQQLTTLSILMRHAGRLVTHDVLERALGDPLAPIDRNAVRLAIYRLRNALGSGPKRPTISTERQLGYRLEPPA